MPLKTAIKWFHRALTTILLIIVIGFVMLNSGGGATVADSYRYYLSGKLEGNVSASLAKQVPFLVAVGSAANVSAEGDTINIKYSGKVFSFSNSVVYEANGDTHLPAQQGLSVN